MHNDQTIVVIGSGLAAYSLVREFRKIDTETAVLILSQDDAHSYSKPMLSTGFTKNKSADELSMADPGKMAAQLKASIRNFTTVTKIDPENSCIYIDDEIIPYHKLVLALGAKVNKLNFPGSEHSKVISINDLMDYHSFRAALKPEQHVLIMGAGLIGCEYANDLINGGYTVTVVDPASTAMNGLIPAEAGNALAEGLRIAGADILFERYVQHIDQLEGDTLCATLNTGQKIPCDLVISAIGLKANTQLAEQAGIKCRQGIITDNYLETSEKNIFALGDCAETQNEVRLYVLPLMASARALAKTLAGDKTVVNFGIMPIATKTPACPVICVPPKNKAGAWYFEKATSGIVGKFINEAKEMSGFVLTGDSIKLKPKLIQEMSQ
jgi:rubredoxin-NAD+ reductase